MTTPFTYCTKALAARTGAHGRHRRGPHNVLFLPAVGYIYEQLANWFAHLGFLLGFDVVTGLASRLVVVALEIDRGDYALRPPVVASSVRDARSVRRRQVPAICGTARPAARRKRGVYLLR